MQHEVHPAALPERGRQRCKAQRWTNSSSLFCDTVHVVAPDAQEAAEEEQAGTASASDVPVPKAKTGIKGTKLRRVLRALASRLLEEQQSELSELGAEGDERR